MTHHYKQLCRDLAECLNTQNFEQIKQFYHQDVTYSVMMNTGKFQDIKGVDKVLTVLQANFGASNDVFIDIEQMVCENKTVCLWGSLSGTIWMDITTTPFKFEATGWITFEDNKIIKFLWMPDTFAILRLTGQITFQMDDKDIINQYLDNLVEMGLIKKNMVTKSQLSLG